jgi:hypothetical protein
MKMLKIILALVWALVAPASSFAEVARIGTYTPVSAPPTTAEVVTVGFYPTSYYELNPASGTYYADLYLWMRWKGPIDPTKTLEFTNMVEEWSKIQEPLLEEPELLEDGSRYQVWRVEGRLAQPFSLTDYPLDHQKLSFMIEDTTSGASKLAYVVDEKSSGIGARVEIPGWRLIGWSARSFEHDYGTNFGAERQASTYSAIEFTAEITRPVSFFVWKLLLPLFIVFCAAACALLIRPQALDARTALPAGALLTAIFLQKSYSDGLPDLGYMVLMDKIYLVAYCLIVVTLVRAIAVYRKAVSEEDACIEQIQRTDRMILVALIAAFLSATAGLVLVN